jgi:hypothetical protein
MRSQDRGLFLGRAPDDSRINGVNARKSAIFADVGTVN